MTKIVYIKITIHLDVSMCQLTALCQKIVLLLAALIYVFYVFKLSRKHAVLIVGLFQQILVFIVQIDNMLEFVLRVAAFVAAAIGKIQHLMADPVFFILHLPGFHLIEPRVHILKNQITQGFQRIPFDRWGKLDKATENKSDKCPMCLYKRNNLSHFEITPQRRPAY